MVSEILRSRTLFLGNVTSVLLAWYPEGSGPLVWKPFGNAPAPSASCATNPCSCAACSRAGSLLIGDIPGSSGTTGLGILLAFWPYLSSWKILAILGSVVSRAFSLKERFFLDTGCLPCTVKVLSRSRFGSLSWFLTGAFGMFGGPGFPRFDKVLGVYAMVEAEVLSGCF